MNRYQYDKINENIIKLEKRTNENGNLLIILGVAVMITLALVMSTLIKIYDIYNEIMPKECNCNNELIIDTDTLTL